MVATTMLTGIGPGMEVIGMAGFGILVIGTAVRWSSWPLIDDRGHG